MIINILSYHILSEFLIILFFSIIINLSKYILNLNKNIILITTIFMQ